MTDSHRSSDELCTDCGRPKWQHTPVEDFPCGSRSSNQCAIHGEGPCICLGARYWMDRCLTAERRAGETKAERVCDWVPIEHGSNVYNTCREGDEFHLENGLELWPFCHHCGGRIEVVDPEDEEDWPRGDVKTTCEPSLVDEQLWLATNHHGEQRIFDYWNAASTWVGSKGSLVRLAYIRSAPDVSCDLCNGRRVVNAIEPNQPPVPCPKCTTSPRGD